MNQADDSGKLKAVSDTLCLAMWHHSTLYFHTLESKTCCHLKSLNLHKDLLKLPPSSLHNSPAHQTVRHEMLKGRKPVECNYCWDVEKKSEDIISARKSKNKALYTEERLEDLKKGKVRETPEYLEISFDNKCNFKCGYCHPRYSSTYYKEVEKFGPIDVCETQNLDLNNWKAILEEDNQYLDMWWSWWPELKQTLQILRITGGEPLLQKSTWRIIDELEDTPAPHLEIHINSNLGIPNNLVQKLADKINILKSKNAVKDIKVFTSIDTWGERAEYIRTGLKLELWQQNLRTLLNETDISVSLMITFNILSLTSFQSLLHQIVHLRKEFDGPSNSNSRIPFDIIQLNAPTMYDVRLLPTADFIHYYDDCLKYMYQMNVESSVSYFSEAEIGNLQNLRSQFLKSHFQKGTLQQGRKEFYLWFNELDRRRETNLLEAFPEMTSFYKSCQRLIGLKMRLKQTFGLSLFTTC